MSSNRWTLEQLKLAFYLYCQLPFGKMHSKNPEIITLSQIIGRTPSAVAMKLVNFASLDPAVQARGVAGLSNASELDRTVWNQFHANWEELATECAELMRSYKLDAPLTEDSIVGSESSPDYSGETRQVLTEQRVKQSFFRKAVLTSYRGKCCMSGLSVPQLLVASHIVPWSKDRFNRLNPCNGLCLSAIHDKAFDRGLITLSDDYKIILSAAILGSDDQFSQSVFHPLEGILIELPERFMPSVELIGYHRSNVFLDNQPAGAALW